MPNHCKNKLSIHGGNAGDILKSLLDTKISGKPLVFDFNKIVPMPGIYEGFVGSVRYFGDLDKVTEEEKAKFDERDLKAFNLMVQLKNMNMPVDPTEWARERWGTKWNAYDAEDLSVHETSAYVRFETAWSPPLPVMLALSEKYPHIAIFIEYADEGGYFVGRHKFHGGKIELEEAFEWTSEAGIKIRTELGYGYCE